MELSLNGASIKITTRSYCLELDIVNTANTVANTNSKTHLFYIIYLINLITLMKEGKTSLFCAQCWTEYKYCVWARHQLSALISSARKLRLYEDGLLYSLNDFPFHKASNNCDLYIWSTSITFRILSLYKVKHEHIQSTSKPCYISYYIPFFKVNIQLKLYKS